MWINVYDDKLNWQRYSGYIQILNIGLSFDYIFGKYKLFFNQRSRYVSEDEEKSWWVYSSCGF